MENNSNLAKMIKQYVGCNTCRLKDECDKDNERCDEYDKVESLLKTQQEDLKEMISNLQLELEIRNAQIESRNAEISHLQKQIADIKGRFSQMVNETKALLNI